VSRSFGFLAGDWARRVLVVCFGCVLRRMASFVWFLGPVKLDHVFLSRKLNTTTSSSPTCSQKKITSATSLTRTPIFMPCFHMLKKCEIDCGHKLCCILCLSSYFIMATPRGLMARSNGDPQPDCAVDSIRLPPISSPNLIGLYGGRGWHARPRVLPRSFGPSCHPPRSLTLTQPPLATKP
jgi:hypothetical protein